jgi:hypothetical protein
VLYVTNFLLNKYGERHGIIFVGYFSTLCVLFLQQILNFINHVRFKYLILTMPPAHILAEFFWKKQSVRFQSEIVTKCWVRERWYIYANGIKSASLVSHHWGCKCLMIASKETRQSSLQYIIKWEEAGVTHVTCRKQAQCLFYFLVCLKHA